MAHAFFIAGDTEQGIRQAQTYLEEFVGPHAHADITTLTYQAFPVEESRKLHDIVYRRPVAGDRKGIIIAVERMFHEAQNALLKVFEEPPEGTVLILVVPSAGMLIPTLRSRMSALPHKNIKKGKIEKESISEIFLKATASERAKIIEKLLVRSKSDKQEEKNTARTEALQIVEALLRATYELMIVKALHPKTKSDMIYHISEPKGESKEHKELQAFLSDLDHFIPILHERSAPLKLILEHILLTIPKGLGKS